MLAKPIANSWSESIERASIRPSAVQMRWSVVLGLGWAVGWNRSWMVGRRTGRRAEGLRRFSAGTPLTGSLSMKSLPIDPTLFGPVRVVQVETDKGRRGRQRRREGVPVWRVKVVHCPRMATGKGWASLDAYVVKVASPTAPDLQPLGLVRFSGLNAETRGKETGSHIVLRASAVENVPEAASICPCRRRIGGGVAPILTSLLRKWALSLLECFYVLALETHVQAMEGHIERVLDQFA